MERFLRYTKQICDFFNRDRVLIFGEVIFERHKVARLFEAKVKFLSNEKKVVVVYFGLVCLLVHGLEKGCFDLLVFWILSYLEFTLLSEIQTSLFVIKYNYINLQYAP